MWRNKRKGEENGRYVLPKFDLPDSFKTLYSRTVFGSVETFRFSETMQVRKSKRAKGCASQIRFLARMQFTLIIFIFRPGETKGTNESCCIHALRKK